MAEIIKDGAGTGNTAAVNSQNRLHVDAVQSSRLRESLDAGKTWNVGTGNLTLTTDTASDVLYIKNTGTPHLIIDLYVVLSKVSTGGSGEMVVEILRNPDGGTVVSDASTITATNMNFSSSLQPTALMYKGGEGKTLTGHDDTLRSQSTADNRLLLGILTELELGASVGIRLTPPAGNTSMVIETVVEVYEEC